MPFTVCVVLFSSVAAIFCVARSAWSNKFKLSGVTIEFTYPSEEVPEIEIALFSPTEFNTFIVTSINSLILVAVTVEPTADLS